MSADERQALTYLRTPEAIRERTHRLLAHGLRGELTHFSVDESLLPAVASRVVAVTQAAYPTLDIPYHSRWNHFDGGGIDRRDALPETGPERFELAILSVLLDAGAGPKWSYRDGEAAPIARSEGLAVASLRMFQEGALSGTHESLESVTPERLAKAFQVSDTNPLVGLDGRAALLRSLGRVVKETPALFGAKARLGGLYHTLQARSGGPGVAARDILLLLLEALGPIWPGRLSLAGENLGDVWRHPKAGGDGHTQGLLPFHKLSQWLAYSLVDTRQQAEEVVQDAFAAVYERFHRVENPEAYLRVTVLNGCRRVLRRRMLSRRQPIPPTENGELGASHVVDAIRRLPHKQRSMIVLRYDLQLTDREIADTLGVPIGTVKSTIHRALAELRKELS